MYNDDVNISMLTAQMEILQVLLKDGDYLGFPHLADRPGLKLLSILLFLRVSSTKFTSGVSVQALTNNYGHFGISKLFYLISYSECRWSSGHLYRL